MPTGEATISSRFSSANRLGNCIANHKKNPARTQMIVPFGYQPSSIKPEPWQ
jgi:hypothetical protein